MKLLLFSDLHCDEEQARVLVEKSRGADVVVCAGDIATMRRGLESTIAVLKEIDQPTVIVPGNSESDDELRQACTDWTAAHVLHGSSFVIDGVTFFGLGGAVPETPFGGWSWDLTEEQAAELLNRADPGGVLISHSPPRGTLDIDSSGKSLGSIAVKQAMEGLVPRLVVCGHIHASAGRKEVIGDTTVINAGPAGLVFELSE